MIDELIDSFSEIISTTKTYKTAVIRVGMIVILTFLMTSVTLIFHNFPSIIKIFSNISKGALNRPATLGLHSILRIEETLASINLPEGYILGIESIKATGVREIYWVSNEEIFNELNKLDINILNRNPQRLQYAKGYSYLVGVCNRAPLNAIHTYQYNYYVCPIKSKNEVIGVVWVLYDITKDNSENGLNVQAELVPLLLEIRDLLEKDGLK
ncbi:MAG: hypothetical protein R3321_01630 [Nitrososphaeraceae archaeon]|nr:hypothetical protein [Nitrososphaeraceae archaeon]